MVQLNSAGVEGRFYGPGAPGGTPNDGQQYVNISTTPFTMYFGYGGSWHIIGNNSGFIDGKGVSTTPPTDGQVLTYINSTGLWTPETPS